MSNNQDNNIQNKPVSDLGASNGQFFQFLKKIRDNTVSPSDQQMLNIAKKSGIALLILLSVFIFVKTIIEIKTYTIIDDSSWSNTISVSGKGEVPAPKDLATVSFVSTGKGITANDAQSIAATSNNKAINFLKSKGIEEKDISNVSYNTNPVFEEKIKKCEFDLPKIENVSTMNSSYVPMPPCNVYESVITGFETTQVVQVYIRGINTNPTISGEVLTGLVEQGVQVGGLQNTIDNSEEFKSRARTIAIANARIQAKQIAKSLGVQLGEVISFSENDMYMHPMFESNMSRTASMEKSVFPEILAGEGKVTSDVSVVFTIK